MEGRMDSLDQLVGIMKRLRKLHLMEPPRVNPELTLSQVELIGYIHNSDGCRIQEIAEGMGLSAPTVSVAVKRLEDDGWLERTPDPTDGRAACITLTKKSRDIFQKVIQAQMMALQKFLEGLNHKEQGQLIGLLDQAVSAAEARKKDNNSPLAVK
jgi:DNA-binding MarR family transcriptional regulator